MSKVRSNAAKEIRGQREIDRKKEESFNIEISRSRGVMEYVFELEGLVHFLSYVRSLSFGRSKVLDIGTGIGKALDQLSQMDEWSYNLDFEGTALSRDKKHKKFSIGNKIRLTSVEQLRGFKQNEFAGIISVYGLGYSGAPEMAAESIDRVLAPGGALKTVYGFPGENDEVPISPDKFRGCLADKSYDIYASESDGKNLNGQDSKFGILLAIKPPISIKAAKLFHLDLEDYENQVQDLMQKGYKDSETEVASDVFNRTLKDLPPELHEKLFEGEI